MAERMTDERLAEIEEWHENDKIWGRDSVRENTAHNHRELLLKALKAEREYWEAKLARVEWQPIETAPKDGSAFLTYIPSLEGIDAFDIAGWDKELETWWKWGCGFHLVTHWMPLPEPPQALEQDD